MRGARALAEPAAARFAQEVAALWEVEPQRVTHPEQLGDVLADLRTYSLFGGGKVVLAIETGAVADRDAASAMLADVRAALPFEGGGEELSGAPRDAARRLLQILRLHDLDPGSGDPESVLGQLPDAFFGKGKAAAAETRRQLEPLLAAALEAGLRGAGENEASMLADLLRDGVPDRHLLVLVESAVASSHPLVEALAQRHAVEDVGELASAKGGRIEGLDRLLAELERETGRAIRRDAAAALVHRTLRGADERGREGASVDPDSAARFAAEYRKLATLAGESVIDRALVESNVEDRGKEEVWPILDAIGDGRGADAWTRIARRLGGAEDAVRERLSLFALLASFARQLVAAGGAVAATGSRRDEGSYARFKERIAPGLQGEIEGIAANPIGRLHAFRLHRVYLAASRFEPSELAELPARVLAAERRLKGESDDPDSVLAELVMTLAKPAVSSAPGVSGGSRRQAAGGRRS